MAATSVLALPDEPGAPDGALPEATARYLEQTRREVESALARLSREETALQQRLAVVQQQITQYRALQAALAGERPLTTVSRPVPDARAMDANPVLPDLPTVGRLFDPSQAPTPRPRPAVPTDDRSIVVPRSLDSQPAADPNARRLDALEQKLDRLLESLDGARSPSPAS